MNTLVYNFKFKPIAKRRKKAVAVKERKLAANVIGIVFIEDGVYKVHVSCATSEEEELPPQLILEFTPDSYNLKGHTKAFTKCYTPRDKWTCYCRTREHSTLFPNLAEQLVPFAHNWEVKGWIVRRNGQLMFKLKQALTIHGYNMWVADEGGSDD